MARVSLEIGHTPNYASVTIGNLTLHFSYRTIIAFEIEGRLYISENRWGTTTGKHLNYLSRDKTLRIPRAEFEYSLNAVLEKRGLA